MSSPAKLLVRQQVSPLQGAITVPGDKSISHRAIILAALAEGHSVIRNWLPAGDTLATLEAIQVMGVTVEVDRKSSLAWDLQVEGRGLRGLRRPAYPINCRNAGTAIRLLAGVLVGQSFPTVLDGSEQLRRRPMNRVMEPLQKMGADIKSETGRAPLQVRPSLLHGIEYRMPVASAQVKSAILLAGLYTSDTTRVLLPGPARDHTERLLTAMGAVVTTTPDGWVILGDAPPGGRRLLPLDMTVPGDFSSAAFPLVAAAIVPGSNVTIRQVGINSTRTGLLEMLRSMGADVSIRNKQVTGGEPIADLTIQFGSLQAIDVAGPMVVRAIDEFPIWTIAATQAEGIGSVHDAQELRVKEVDRIAVLAGELRRMGIELTEYPDGYAVTGPRSLRGSPVASHDDHRLGMALAVAGLIADGTTLIHDAPCMADSFPGFVETMQQLGATMEWVGTK